MTKTSSSPIWQIGISIIIFLIISAYSIALLIEAPYAGFWIYGGNIVNDIYVNQNSSPILLKKDKILSINNIHLDNSNPFIWQESILNVQSGDIIDLMVEREENLLHIPWVIPGPNTNELFSRVMLLLSPYLFWVFGTATLFLIRPKNNRWRLLVAFSFISALRVCYAIASYFYFRPSVALYQASIWLSIPIFLHLHWEFPRSLKRLPQYLIITFYLPFILLALYSVFSPTPFYIVYAMLMLAVLGSIILLIMHAILQKDLRSTSLFLAGIFSLVYLPSFTVIVAGLLNINILVNELTILPLWVISAVYFFVSYRKQLVGFELRANRSITLILFSVILFSIIFPLTVISGIGFLNSTVNLATTIVLIIGFSLVTLAFYPPFQSFVDRYLLGIRLPPDRLIQAYILKTITSLDEKQIIHLLQNIIFPSLLIQESALLRLNNNSNNGHNLSIETLFTSGLSDRHQLPTPEEIEFLINQNSKSFSTKRESIINNPRISWIQASLPMSIENNLIGICLLGQRDPDNFYSQTEIDTLQAIMNQTALALISIDQSKQLHAFYQNDIARQEAERSRLARELHDDVLGQMAILAQSIDPNGQHKQFREAYQTSIKHIRNIIQGLRPTMINYGIKPALDQLIEELSMLISLNSSSVKIISNLPNSQNRYAPDAELHIYRIVQEACNNAIKHAHAHRITLNGKFESELVELEVIDDGIGFKTIGPVDMTGWLMSKQYGLAGMYERAQLINADVEVVSSPGNGTRVHIIWNQQNKQQ
jgi:signal transduction histidine kinase